MEPQSATPVPPPPATSADIEILRESEFPWSVSTIYLNHASIGPLPQRTRRILDRFNRERAQPALLTDERLLGILETARERAAALVGAEPEEIALAPNTSYGLNLAARSMPLEPGDVVLLSDKEFPANVYPWLRLADRGVSCELSPTTAAGWPDEDYLLDRIRDPRVRMLAVSLVQFSNGYTVDLARLSAATRETGTLLVVDAIQALGQIPIDLAEVEVDLLACGGQKWLLSPWGSGFCYVRRELIAQLEPVFMGWMAFEGTDDFRTLTDYNPTLRSDARRFEMVTLPFQDFLGLNASIEMLLSVGIERIQDHLDALNAPVHAWASAHGVEVTSPADAHRSGILCLAPPGAPQVHAALAKAGIVCSLREGALRLSPHLYNTAEEMARVLEVLERELA